jgi:hypothetical protein
MGASQSKISEPVITEKLAERLRAMQLEHEKEYVVIESGDRLGGMMDPQLQTHIAV